MVLPTIILPRYGQRVAARYRQKGRTMKKKELLTVKELSQNST